MNPASQIPVEIYAESTPNPHTMKFVANVPLLDEGQTMEFAQPYTGRTQSLIKTLFELSFVKHVFLASNFIAVTINSSVDWAETVAALRKLIKNHLNSGNPLVGQTDKETIKQAGSKEENDTEQKIRTILRDYMQPAAAQDGGFIQFSSFEEGVLTVRMSGACHGCPSAARTLQTGIEQLFKQLLPEVKQVVAEEF